MHQSSVAIVGIGGIFPDAPDLARFWDNIRLAKNSARVVPEGRWHIPVETAFHPEVGKADHVYSRHSCFIEEIPSLDGLAGLAPGFQAPTGLDPLFHLLIHAGKRAFDDGITEPLDRSRIGVIIGNLALPSETSAQLARQWLGRTFEEKLLGHASPRADVNPINRYVAGLPAGLLAAALGLGGGSCTLDAACASSLYAIKLAASELLSGRADAMLTGGLSRPDPLYTQMGFSQLRALSRRGICSPFDSSGDGLVVGEGAGIFLLKRTEDALAHGDRIYGIIRGIGLANDVGGSLLAPLSEGQLRAMRSAYTQAGWDPRDVDLIECHATGTQVGDATEVASLRELWGNARPDGRACIIGSIKSNIGHLLTAAGAAALTKVLLAMAEEQLPPTANFSAPQPGMDLDNSPFRVLSEGIAWERRGNGIPRRAAVSAFGFGGINAHLLVEEWLPESGRTRPAKQDQKPKTHVPVAIIGMDARFGPWQSLRSFQERVLGDRAHALPAPPTKWWGAQESIWFQEQGLQQTPFSGYYLDEVAVATDQFRIPPREMEEMLPQQILMLSSAAAAMADAGLDREGNQRAGVFMGIALDLNSTNFSFRWSLAEQAAVWARELGRELSDEELAAWTAQLRDDASPPLTANRTMGALGNIVASRIAREFRVGGPSFALASEENSGIRSLETALRMLQSGEIDRALVGAVDLAGDLRSVLGQHAGREFSRSGRGLPFDQRADGAIVGEGAACVVLKRLDDAEHDGDRIYAVIRGIGTSSGTTTIPDQAAYCQALERAYCDAGVNPATITYLEAHASGHPAEDCMEAAALAIFFGTTPTDDAPPRKDRSCAISSVAADIGQSGAASGLASLVRGCLALYQEIIPPCRGLESPCNELSGPGPLYLPRTPRYWLRNRAEGPRRAGISAFGMDGGCSHVVLEGWDALPPRAERIAPLGAGSEFLFSLTGVNRAELARGLDLLRQRTAHASDDSLATLAREWYGRGATHDLEGDQPPRALALVARNRDELLALVDLGKQLLASDSSTDELLAHPALHDRLFYSSAPLGLEGKVAFVFPGSGNHYPGMGMELSCRWPEIFRLQDGDNLYLRSQFQPERFWNGAPPAEINNDHRAVLFGQVATGCAVSDLLRDFGVEPQASIGYSLGESAAFFALGAWHDRDGMLSRMHNSTLFTRDLAGECRAAQRAWGLAEGSRVEWSIGVVTAPAPEVRTALEGTARVYLLIVNTPDECVIGGDSRSVGQLVERLGRPFFPLQGVTTVHCEVAREVAVPYRQLHLFPTTPPAGIRFYSGAKNAAYELNRESAADSILAQALEGINFPATIEQAYSDGVRLFLEMGPGSSCSRMIGRILENRPHLARSICHQGQDPVSGLLRLLAQLVAERVPLDLSPLFAAPVDKPYDAHKKTMLRVPSGGMPFQPSLPPRRSTAIPVPPTSHPNPLPKGEGTKSPISASMTLPRESAPERLHRRNGERSPHEQVIHDFAAAQQARLKAHEAYLRVSENLTGAMAQALQLQVSLRQALGDGALPDDSETAIPPPPPHLPREGGGTFSQQAANTPLAPATSVPCVFDRAMCLEFARGSVSRMLGPDFAELDSFPTRVRLPDEPLMLVDRIVTLEGEARSMTSGRVVTEHDIHAGAWYLDGGRIPTCIAVEAGQADLFLSGYLGIDFITRGQAVYRLLDAVVTFHRALPGPGETIRYDIRIERFFRQGDTYLFRFRFDATVNGEALLTMQDGCAGFFTSHELDAGKGIIRPAIDLRPTRGTRPADWRELVAMVREGYDRDQLDRLRTGDLAGCFGPLFALPGLTRPLTIPGGAMQLVHRVCGIDPDGGHYGLGQIVAEADIHPQDWFITCHFVDDRVMPGTLMYECCMHTLRIFLLRMGWVAEDGQAAWEPVPGVASRLCCRGQVLETTKIVTYEVCIRELGYGPEPYAIADALMYADGRPIVEITSMSVRLSGSSREKLEALWEGSSKAPHPSPLPGGEGVIGRDDRKPAIYTKQQILAYSNGNPSEGFGEPYRIFDSGRKIARLPGPPFQFMDRITAVQGEPWRMVAGVRTEAQYDVPTDAWYFAADRQQRMPFAVLLEAALQPCGWLAAYIGSALTTANDISFRNLGGNAVQHRPVTPASGTLTASACMKKVATSGGMIIQEYDFSVTDRDGVLYEGETMFGFFSREALASQVGIRDATPYQPTAEEHSRGRSLSFPREAPFPEQQLAMIDRIELFVPDGGPAGLGYVRGIKDVNPEEWFFKAHFYQDPVTPGSLGLESFLQLVKFAAVERWGWDGKAILAAMTLGQRHRWLYRGQVVPTNSRVCVEAWITTCDDERRILLADGFLSVDGRTIYQMNDFSVRMI
ncbi:MAG: type I polyketide synthase [Desulfuromonadales bacterium]|nr:type I polyketide synthase [Desulfuromonadales bacterium]